MFVVCSYLYLPSSLFSRITYRFQELIKVNDEIVWDYEEDTKNVPNKVVPNT